MPSHTLSLAYFLLLSVHTQTVIGLPFSLYSTFVVEAKHGFNKQTLGLFFADKVSCQHRGSGFDEQSAEKWTPLLRSLWS